MTVLKGRQAKDLVPAPVRQRLHQAGLDQRLLERLHLGRLSRRLSVRRIPLEQLDDELAVAAELFIGSQDQARSFLERIELTPPQDTPNDPFSLEYQHWTWDLYHRISGRDAYSVANESSPFDLGLAIRRPFPYQTASPTVVGHDLEARGIVLRCLGSPAVDLQPPARLVEFGPGWGNLTADLRATGYQVTAVKVGPSFCQLLDQRLGMPVDGLSPVTISQSDMLSFTSDEPLDAAIFYESFHHCADHLAMLEQLQRLVKRSGAVVLAAEPIHDMPYPWGPRLDGLSLWSMRTYGWLELGFDRHYFRQALDRTGWRLEPPNLGPFPSGIELLVAKSTRPTSPMGDAAPSASSALSETTGTGNGNGNGNGAGAEAGQGAEQADGCGGWSSELVELLHRLRGEALSEEPGGAEVVVSGGAPDETYATWFAAQYPTAPKRHILVEKFRQPPDSLPPGVEFVQGSLGDLAEIADESVDLVFAGQITEHLWADDLAGFLLAARRILRPGGALLIDSPNRAATLATGWHMPEHTLELTAAEIRELLALAGFDVELVRGLWLCIDPVTATPIPVGPAESPALWPVARRVAAATEDPDHSFIWWVRARRSERQSDPGRVRRRTEELFTTYRQELFGRLVRPLQGLEVEHGGLPAVVESAGRDGYILIGPFVALPGGEQHATFTFVVPRGFLVGEPQPPDMVAAYVDVAVGDERRVVAERPVTVAELPCPGEITRITLHFSLPDTTFGCETRVRTTGAVPLEVILGVQVRQGAAPGPDLERAPEGTATWS